jgi:hypothetical protein
MKDQKTWASRHRSTSPGAEISDGVSLDAAALDCSLDELQEFLEADLVDVKIDREFKECLRTRLWDMVQLRNRTRASQVRRS